MTEATDRNAARLLLVLYAANSFLFLMLSFFFLPDAIVKVVGSAAAVVFTLLGLKGLNPREADTMSLLRRHRPWVIGVLLLIALLQAVLLGIGYVHPCRIVAIPGSTVTVDGKFLARTPDPTPQQRPGTAKNDPSDNIRPWLTPRQTKHWLRWDTHEIRVSKKWYVDVRDRSEESVKNVSVNLLKLWIPREAFRDWIVNVDQKPFLKISYGIKEQPTDAEDLPLARDLRLAVEDWDRLWLKAMSQKDDLPHNRTEPYVAALQVVQEHQTPHIEFEIRDWTDHALKALRPILDISADINAEKIPKNADIKADELNTPLEKIRTNVFAQLLEELAIQGETITLSETSKKVAVLTQTLLSSVSSPEAGLEVPGYGPPAEGPSATPGPAATVTASATPTLPATPTPNPIDAVNQLQAIATAAVDKNQLDSAVAVRTQLQATLDKVRTQSASKPTTELVQSLERANVVIRKAIKEKSRSGRIYIHIASESQRDKATNLLGKLAANNQFVVMGIQNVGGRAYIPDAAEVRFFAERTATKQAADNIVEILKRNGVSNVQSTFVKLSDREKEESSDINTHFEIWFARNSFAEAD